MNTKSLKLPLLILALSLLAGCVQGSGKSVPGGPLAVTVGKPRAVYERTFKNGLYYIPIMQVSGDRIVYSASMDGLLGISGLGTTAEARLSEFEKDVVAVVFLGGDKKLLSLRKNDGGLTEIDIASGTGKPIAGAPKGVIAPHSLAASPNGSKLAFIAYDKARDRMRATVLNQGKPTPIAVPTKAANSTPASLSFSPDGKRLAYLAHMSDSGMSESRWSEIWVIDIQRGSRKLVADTRKSGWHTYGIATISWSPRGDVLAYIEADGGKYIDDQIPGSPAARVGLLDIRDGRRRAITGVGTYFGPISWSQSGDRIYYTRVEFDDPVTKLPDGTRMHPSFWHPRNNTYRAILQELPVTVTKR